jgi:hypothetical protein
VSSASTHRSRWEVPGPRALPRGSSGRLASSTVGVARETHSCFQRRLQLGYSRFGAGHPSPAPNREWMLSGSRRIAQSKSKATNSTSPTPHQRSRVGTKRVHQHALDRTAVVNVEAESPAITGDAQPFAVPHAPWRWIAPRRSRVRVSLAQSSKFLQLGELLSGLPASPGQCISDWASQLGIT